MATEQPSDTYTTLLAAEAAELAVEAKDAIGVEYGTPLVEAVQREAPWGSWLEAALLAGHVPYLDTVPMLIRASHFTTLRGIERYVEQDVLGDAEGLVAASLLYREVAQLLERLATELDDVGRDLRFRKRD